VKNREEDKATFDSLSYDYSKLSDAVYIYTVEMSLMQTLKERMKKYMMNLMLKNSVRKLRTKYLSNARAPLSSLPS
jgi:hypothetical protein